MRVNLHFPGSYLLCLNLSLDDTFSWYSRHWQGWWPASQQTQQQWKTQQSQWCLELSLSFHTFLPCTTSLPLTDTYMFGTWLRVMSWYFNLKIFTIEGVSQHSGHWQIELFVTHSGLEVLVRLAQAGPTERNNGITPNLGLNTAAPSWERKVA